MPLSKEAIQHIESQALAAAGREISTSSAEVVVLPDGVALHSLERFEAGRYRFRGALATHSLRDFSKYVEHHAANEAGAHGFIDQDRMAASVIFNLGTTENAGHGDDTATLTLKPTAAYTALQAIVGKGLSQQQLAEWLEDWAQHITAKANDEILPTLTAIAAVRRMTIKASSQRDSVVGDFNASRSAMDEIEAKSLDTLPTAFVFCVVPFEGLKAADILLRLSVISGKEEPVLKLRWVGEETQREEFAREFKGVLDQEVGGFVPLTIGTFAVGK